MATGTNSSEEIIEKKAGSPVASSCLVLACVALLGAIAFQVAEIAEYRTGRNAISTNPNRGPGAVRASSDIKTITNEVDDVLALAVSSGGGALDGGGSLDLDPLEGTTPEDGGSEPPSEDPLDALDTDP